MLGRSIGRLAAIERQCEIESTSFLNTSGAIHHRGLDPYLTAVGLDDGFADRQSHAHPPGLGGKERFKKMGIHGYPSLINEMNDKIDKKFMTTEDK
jgi:protein-disulfide isomerase-like protein with CxxC motif